MAHDVFISYSSKDKPTADAVCAILEAECIRCWIAPRDVPHGQDWGESLIAAINGSRVMVLVLSSSANASPQIVREVERAVSKGIPIIPLRIEEVKPTASLEYFLSTPHWLDAFNPPLERHLRYLAQVIHKILLGPVKRAAPNEPAAKAAPPPIARETVEQALKETPPAAKMTATTEPARKERRKIIWASALLTFVVLGLAGWWHEFKQSHQSSSANATAMIAPAVTTPADSGKLYLPAHPAPTAPASSASEPFQWQSVKGGLLVTYGLGTFMDQGVEATAAGQVPTTLFAPTGLDARQWAHVAKQAGYSLAVLTVKGDDGFCLWPTKASDYSVANSPVKTDIVDEFVTACRAEGIEPGLNYSVQDAHNAPGVKWNGPVGPGYYVLIKNQLVELAARYPEVRVILIPGSVQFTTGQFDELCNTIKALNPQCLVPNVIEPDGRHYVRNWNGANVNKNRYWKANDQLESVADLLKQYSNTPNWQPVFLVSVGPDRAGHIPDEYVARLMEFSKLMGMSPAATVSSVPPTATKAPAAERLKELKDLLDQGLISQGVYDQKKKEILNSP